MEKETEILKRLVKSLEEANVDYVIVGGIVAIHYGRSRLTQDIDIVVGDVNLDNLIKALRDEGFDFSEKDLRTAYAERSRVTIFLSNEIFHVDLKFANDQLDFEVLKDKKRGNILGVDYWIESLEDIIVAKLIYGSMQDEEDVIAILNKIGRIDENLKEKAKKFHVYEKLCGIAEMIGIKC